MANLNSVKNENKYTLLELVRKNREISRAELSRKAGLTRATVSALVSELINEGFVRELGIAENERHKVGRKPLMLTVDKESRLFLGLDLHWDYFQYAVSNINGDILFENSLDLEKRLEPAEYFCLLTEALKSDLSFSGLQDKISATGVSLFGVVNTSSGVMEFPEYMPWPTVELSRYLEWLPKPIYLETRSAASLVAETFFHGDEFPEGQVVVFINVIEGIGGAVMVNGEILKNNHISTGEIGHTTIDINGSTCNCGKRGCLEAYVSDKKLVEYYVSYSDSLSFSTGSIRSLAKMISKLSTSGDRPSLKAITQIADNLSIGLANVINFLSPRFLIIGGFITEAWSLVEPMLLKNVSEHTLPGLSVSTRIVKNHYGDRSGLIGAIAVSIKGSMRSILGEESCWLC